jgi:thiol:disulfide interchange protein DsbD
LQLHRKIIRLVIDNGSKIDYIFKIVVTKTIKHHLSSLWILLLSLLLFYCVSQKSILADAGKTNDAEVKVQTFWSVDRARPGDSPVLAIVVDIKPGFHINANERQLKPLSDFKPYPTKVLIKEASDGLTLETPRYPQAQPLKVKYADNDLMSFEGRTIILLPMKLDPTINQESVRFKMVFEYQACAANYCLFPQKVSLEEKLRVAKQGERIAAMNENIFANFDPEAIAKSSSGVQFDLFGWTFSINASSLFGRILLLLIAALGGFLLNLTPCVLPLIPIKIISLSHTVNNKKRCFSLGISMFLGVLVFWFILGGLVALVSDFTATNQLFQYPAFTIFIGVIIGIMAVGMLGAFSMRLPNFIYTINPEQDSLPGSFALGILAAILSTPCTAPFMGAAAAWASTQTPLITLSIFSAIGIGMALPYLVLSAFPKWVGKVPKTGPASVLIKQIMALFMLAAAAYFIGGGISAVFSSPPNPPGKLYWWPVMLCCAAAGGWMIYRTNKISSQKRILATFATIGTIIIALSIWGGVRLSDKGPIDWVYYTPQRFEEATNYQKVVVMVFTAEWCLNCKALEQTVFNDPEIVALFAKDSIVPIKVDISGNNPAGKAKLKQVGKLTIPLMVIYSSKGNQVFKSDFYTAEQVIDAVTSALQNAGLRI